MKSLVLELQADCLDHSVSTTSILRKAWAVAKKLSVSDFEETLNHELNGYPNPDEVPAYRMLSGQLMAFNPYRGYIPVIVHDPKTANVITQKPITVSIPEIEDLLARPNESSTLVHTFPSSVSAMLMKQFQMDFVPSLHIGSSAFRGLIEHVRNSVLNWSLELEKNGVIGEQMTFTDEEKRHAGSTISNSTVIFGDMNSSVVQSNVGGDASATVGVDPETWDALQVLHDNIADNRQHLEKLIDESEKLAKSIDELESIINEASGPASKPAGILRALKGLLISVATDLIAGGIVYQIDRLLPLLGGP